MSAAPSTCGTCGRVIPTGEPCLLDLRTAELICGECDES